MSDKIGVLGSGTTAAIGTTTVYTCPTAKAAKMKMQFSLQGNAAGASVVEFFVNGMSIGKIAAMTASFFCFSIAGAGLRVAEQAAQPTGIGSGLTVAPAEAIYFLSAGQTVTYIVSGAALIAMNCQVVGTEIDV